MRDRRIWPCARDCIEGKVAQAAGRLAQSVQLGGSRQLGFASLWRFETEPVEKPSNRRTVAGLSCAVTRLFDRVLDRLGQHRGIAQFDNFCSGRFERCEDCLDRPIRVNRHPLAFQRGKCRNKGLARGYPHRIAQMRAQFRRHLFLGHEELRRAVGVGNHERQGNRRPLNIRAPDIEQPGDPIKRRYHCSIQLLFGQPLGHHTALFFARHAGKLGRMDDRRSKRRLRPIGPDGINRIAFGRDQTAALLAQCLAHGAGPALAMKPGIIADPGALGGMFAQPAGYAGLRHGDIAVKLAINLFAHLQRVASINEDRGLIGKHYRCPGRAAKAGQPGEPLGIGADIFAHVFVGNGHDEAVEVAAL